MNTQQSNPQDHWEDIIERYYQPFIDKQESPSLQNALMEDRDNLIIELRKKLFSQENLSALSKEALIEKIGALTQTISELKEKLEYGEKHLQHYESKL